MNKPYRIRRSLLAIAIGLGLSLCLVEWASAGTWGVHVASIHAPQREQSNTNPGLYYRADNGLGAGFYRNSHKRTSLYVGQSIALGPVDLNLGIVSGYSKRCTQSFHETSEKKFYDEGGRQAYSITTNGVRTEDCTGFSRGALTPLAAFSVVAPFTVLGATPRLFFMPGFKRTSSVIHIALEFTK